MSASVIFFAGGDQLKITSRFGGTQICEIVRQRYAEGALIAGTSSGAAVMSETMLVAGGEDNNSHQGKEDVRMAPGLGFLPGVIIDQHFAERGRISRLLGAIAQNPRLLGIGIDEDTAICFTGHHKFSVIGSGAVYVIDAKNMSFTDVAEDTRATSSIHGIALHVLAAADEFDLTTRTPILPPATRKRAVKQQMEKKIDEQQDKGEGQDQ
jgi:cyanophycinase